MDCYTNKQRAQIYKDIIFPGEIIPTGQSYTEIISEDNSKRSQTHREILERGIIKGSGKQTRRHSRTQTHTAVFTRKHGAINALHFQLLLIILIIEVQSSKANRRFTHYSILEYQQNSRGHNYRNIIHKGNVAAGTTFVSL